MGFQPVQKMLPFTLFRVPSEDSRTEHQEKAPMSIIRMIVTTVPPGMGGQAERNWKEKCAPLMIKQLGCLSEHLLRSRDNPAEYISYAEWDNEESIRAYLKGADHQTIKRHNENIAGAKVVVKEYDIVR
jgi:heme-degrading monooxygenase HmoA